MADDRQRIDKWLWFARMAKTRSVAQDLAQSGHVRINGRKIDAASQPVKVGDVLTLGLRGHVRVLKVLAFAERRGSFPQAQLLYEDLAPPPPRPSASGDDAGRPDGADEDDAEGPDDDAAAGATAPGAPPQPAGLPHRPRPVRGEGRPTKRDRRRFDRFEPDGSG
ncbi:RNA-binding S4 domain-containing protein [Chthonobacter rhizosphaerae]|uniref:RNA-binding S4 domain-containing protein n=1 Tax=Chthonobacter rhizosphaerae TaxID=2735553 RepID=UPI0031B57250